MQRRSLIVLTISLLSVMLFALWACAPRSADPSEASDDPMLEVVLPEWSPDLNCVTCHVNEGTSLENAGTLVFTHATEGKPCVSCHSDEATLSDIHEGKTMESRLPKELEETAIERETCTLVGCHNVAALITATADYKVLSDANHLVVNPHDLSTGQGHANINCTSCHSMHVAEVNLDEQSLDLCFSCHHEHEFSCYTCHK
jgi:predicted CXXCH cytochrome family protein